MDRDIRKATVHSLSLDELAKLVDEVPPDLTRGLITPVPPGRLPAEGTIGIPALAAEFSVRHDGLAVPHSQPRVPIDFVGVVLSLKEDFGASLDLDSIHQQLSQLPLRKTLWVLTQVVQRLDRWSDRAELVDLARNLFPGSIVETATNLLLTDERRHPSSAQNALALAMRALVHCQDPGPEEMPENLLIGTVGLLLLAVADHVGPSTDSQEELALEVVRNELFFRLQGHREWYSEAFHLLFRILPEMAGDPDFIDPDEILQNRHGISLSDFWVLNALLGGVLNFRSDAPVRFTGEWGEITLPHETLEAWVRVWTQSIEEARDHALRELDAGLSWSFSTFRDRPLLDFGDARTAVRSHYLTEKASITGMFWAIRDAFGDDIPYEQWARLFGRCVEQRCRELLQDHVGDPSRIVDESLLRLETGPGAVCDFLILYPGKWVAVEVVFRQMSRATQVDGGYEALLADLGYAAVEKLMQIDAVLDRAMDRGLGGLPPPTEVYPLVVVGSSFPSNPLVKAELKRQLETQAPRRLGVDPRVKAPSVIDLHELRSFLAVATRDGETLPELLGAWLNSGLADVALRTWLSEIRRGTGDWWRDEDWIDQAVDRLFRGADSFPA